MSKKSKNSKNKNSLESAKESQELSNELRMSKGVGKPRKTRIT